MQSETCLTIGHPHADRIPLNVEHQRSHINCGSRSAGIDTQGSHQHSAGKVQTPLAASEVNMRDFADNRMGMSDACGCHCPHRKWRPLRSKMRSRGKLGSRMDGRSPLPITAADSCPPIVRLTPGSHRWLHQQRPRVGGVQPLVVVQVGEGPFDCFFQPLARVRQPRAVALRVHLEPALVL
jgi:hypothetical protein